MVLSGGSSAAKIDTSEDLVLADRDVIVTTLNIKAMEFGPHEIEYIEHDRKFPFEHGTNIPMISSLGKSDLQHRARKSDVFYLK